MFKETFIFRNSETDIWSAEINYEIYPATKQTNKQHHRDLLTGEREERSSIEDTVVTTQLHVVQRIWNNGRNEVSVWEGLKEHEDSTSRNWLFIFEEAEGWHICHWSYEGGPSQEEHHSAENI